MNSWLIQLKREFWEYNTAFLLTPAVIAALAVLVGIYVVIAYGTPESEFAHSVFGYGDDYAYQTGTGNDSGDNSNPARQDHSETTVNADSNSNRQEYIVDFSKGEIAPVEQSDRSDTDLDIQFNAAAFMYGIQHLFLTITAFVLLFYALNCLYADRKDRSILFWKSMPVSEIRNVTVKFIITVLAVPVVVTLISWLVQLFYLLLATIFVYRIGSDPWTLVWSNLDVLDVFFQQLKYVLWGGAWFLPLIAWLLFASSLARRSPFLLATIPFVFVILMERLLFGSWSVGLLLLQHLRASALQIQNIMGDDSFAGATPGRVNMLLNLKEMLTGIVIAGLLFPATVWLRNRRFEI